MHKIALYFIFTHREHVLERAILRRTLIKKYTTKREIVHLFKIFSRGYSSKVLTETRSRTRGLSFNVRYELSTN